MHKTVHAHVASSVACNKYVTLAERPERFGAILVRFTHVCAGYNKKHSIRSETALVRKQCKGKKERPQRAVGS